MKILVPIKRVVDSNVKVRVLSDGSGVDTNHLKMAMNPFCEIAVEEAVRLKEAGVATEVVVVTVGDKACQEQIRSAMALGADRGIHVEALDTLLPIDIAKCLVAVQQQERADLLLLGKQSIDGDNNQTAQMVAALLDIPQACFASVVKHEGGQLLVTREIDGGLQHLSLPLPAVVSADLRLNEPRYAKLPDIMKAKRKVLDVFSLEALGVTLKAHQQVINVKAPAQRQAGVMLSSVAELVEKLKHEAKVI
ncbi:MAG: electron transfer flavoprotein subunit beta/FixA family protein [Shewanella sp.]|uniref:electron transfer flavoprotein subunit beta/FixA family protein n=1 Tax=Shewanella sp. SNU WT4 TaxID=2590015 RepID=UPI00112C211C|nr:electron transfer flavoprotein subunit beta/FixA family protein [Shewanella sp. SNU WT4]QDF67742.1 electron transfer flavoprotein subunit beta/FixA family protein [Shewanella sp. SNU WT4]